MLSAQKEQIYGQTAVESIRLLLRPEEGANAIGVSRARFYELMAEGRIKSINIGRSRRVPVAELQDWIAAELAEQSA
jgi:excisionase family DNA binding protein